MGVSVRTILANVLMQSIIFLYLMDNSDGTSWMILFGQGMGILLEAWKITKTVDVRVREADPNSMLPYKITFEDKHKLSETEEKTKEYDAIAFKYMYLIAIPLLGAYAVYSLVYESHKSWYSFVITTLVGSVYAYGFLMMVPSLYINYRLKVSYLIASFFEIWHTNDNPERRTHASTSNDLQIPKYLHRRFICFHYKDAYFTSACNPPR